MKKKLAAGCIAAAAVITAGSLAMVWQDSQVPELPNYTDPVVEQTIEDDDTPLASAPKVTTKTTRNTKTSRKNIKLNCTDSNKPEIHQEIQECSPDSEDHNNDQDDDNNSSSCSII